MPARPDLLAAYWTIAGDVWPGAPSEVSPFPFAERVAAAAEAGFTGVGLVHQDIVAVRDAIGLAEMRRLLDAHGIVHVEVEFLADWAEDGERRRSSDAVRRDLLEAAEALGARDLKVAPQYDVDGVDLDRLGPALATLCAEAAAHGTRVALEVMPFSNVATLETGLALLEAAGSPANGGLLLDIWHVVRGGIPYAAVRALPPGTIVSVELDDAAAEVEGSLWDDTILHRRRCGEGVFDIAGFVAAVEAAGYDGPYGVEVISTEHRLLPLAEAARRGFDTTAASLAAPRS